MENCIADFRDTNGISLILFVWLGACLLVEKGKARLVSSAQLRFGFPNLQLLLFSLTPFPNHYL